MFTVSFYNKFTDIIMHCVIQNMPVNRTFIYINSTWTVFLRTFLRVYF